MQQGTLELGKGGTCQRCGPTVLADEFTVLDGWRCQRCGRGGCNVERPQVRRLGLTAERGCRYTCG